MAWNSDVYGNMTQALYSPNGLAIVALLVKIGESPNPEFEVIAEHLNLVKYKGQQIRVRHLSVHDMMPQTTQYITYEGSLTYPSCHETVTWIIPNKPFYITQTDLIYLRQIMVGTADLVMNSMENNFRPVMPLNHRPVRTNINFQNSSKGCTMERRTYYQANVLENS